MVNVMVGDGSSGIYWRKDVEIAVYVAAPFGERGEAAQLRDELVERGFRVVSRWLDLPPGTDGNPRASADRKRAADACHADVRKCDVLLFLDSSGFRARGALVEVGIALERGLGVVWVPDGRPSASENVFDGRATVLHPEPSMEAIVSALVVEALLRGRL